MMSDAKTQRTEPLNVAIVDGRLEITMGVETFKTAVQYGPDFGNISDPEEIDVYDPDTFANEVLRCLEAEEEDGTTVIHRMLDRAIERAVEHGAEGIRLPEDEP